MTAGDFAAALDRCITLRYFPRNAEEKRGGAKLWRAATSGHYYTSDTDRLVLADSDCIGNVEEGWGDTPEDACADLGRAMMASLESRRRGCLAAEAELSEKHRELEQRLAGGRP